MPLKTVIDPSQIKDPTKDPSPKVTLDQAVAEVGAAYRTFGDRLMSVEIGNEYDNVTTLTPAQYYATMKEYSEAIARPSRTRTSRSPARPPTPPRPTPSSTGSWARCRPTLGAPRGMISELTSHYYPGSHCGSSTESIAGLMSATTYTDPAPNWAGSWRRAPGSAVRSPR